MTIVPDAHADAGGTLRGPLAPRAPHPDGAAASEILERLTRELQAILDVTPSSLRVFDAEGTLARFNATAAAEHADEARPRTIRALWEQDAPLRAAPTGKGDVRVAFEDHPAMRALRGESVRSATFVVRRGREGERRVVETFAGPVRDGQGEVVGAVLVDRDATERARLARALEEQVRRTMELNERVLTEAEELERMVDARSREMLALQDVRARERRLAAVGQLAAGVMHDVNNALNPIMAAAYLLQRRANDPDAVRDYAERIAKAAETCAASAARVGRFIRQDPPAEGRDVVVDLSTLAEEVLAMTSASLAEGLQGAQVELDRRYAEDVVARGIPGEIREALLNLVNNAVDAMPTGGRVTVATGVRADGGDTVAWVEVRDTGTGMNEDVRDRAFEPFFTTKGAGGSGLGLAEVYGIMKRHRGRAEIESVPNRGTTVRLLFPSVSREAVAEPVTTYRLPSPARRVLIVEDNTDGREFLRALLVSEGHAVDAVADIGSARTMLGSDPAAVPYDVLVTDLGLPDGNGWDLVRETRRRWPHLRIGVVTGWEPQTHGAGPADFVLRKPLRADELLALVAQERAIEQQTGEHPVA